EELQTELPQQRYRGQIPPGCIALWVFVLRCTQASFSASSAIGNCSGAMTPSRRMGRLAGLSFGQSSPNKGRQTIFKEVSAMAEGQSEPLSMHHFTWRGLISRWAPYWLLFAVFTLIAIGLLALALARPQSGTLLPALLCLGIAVACLIAPLVAFLCRPRRAEVYRDRLVWRTGAGEHQASWDMVASVHRFERLTNNLWYQTALTLTLADGSKVIFDHSLSGFADLANNVQQQMAQHMLPKKEAE